MKAVWHTLSFLGVFVVGMLLSFFVPLPEWVYNPNITLVALYILMCLVGITVGGEPSTLAAITKMSPRLLLLPVATLVGTFAGALVGRLLFPSYLLKELLAVASGFGYYSLSCVIITEKYNATLGAVALLSSISRELMALLLARPFAKIGGNLAPICAAGGTSMDTTLPFIVKATAPEYSVVCIYHGVVITLFVPFGVGLALPM